MNQQFKVSINEKCQKINYNLYNSDIQLESTMKTMLFFLSDKKN